jgi:polar amino acid transport system substrate-binding protein
MRRTVLVTAIISAVGITAWVSSQPRLHAQRAIDPRIADLVQAGRVRVGLGLGTAPSAIKDAKTGEVRGPAMDMARALAARIGVELASVEYPRPGAVIEGARAGDWDVAFLAIDPARAAEADFSPPYMQYDLTYMVQTNSTIRTSRDVDQPGVRVAVPRGDISDLRLSRTLKRAELLRADTVLGAFELARTGQANVLAGIRPNMLQNLSLLPGYRILDDGFGLIVIAAVVPKEHPGRLAYVSEFVEDAINSRIVQQAIDRAGLRGIKVLASGKPSLQQ